MKTDTILYQLFQTFPSLLFELIGHFPTEAQGYNFSSPEIKELAFCVDGVFLPTTNSFDQPIYFLEVQFQSKSDFYWRLFTEIFLYLGQNKPNNDWRAVAIFASRNLDPGVPRQYRGLLMSQQVQFVYLDELEAMFGLDELKQTRYFQEVAEEAAAKAAAKARIEGKLETVPRLLQLGLSVEQIATALELNVELVEQAALASVADNPQDEGTEN